jgi:chromosome partitioning protein
VAAFENNPRVTRSFQLRIPPDVRQLVIDTPAGLPAQRLSQFTRGAHAILVPVLSGDMDIHAASRLITDLLLVAKVSRRMGRLGVIANRVRENTLSYRRLMRFLQALNIPVVTVLRDSQSYLRAVEQGLGLHEMPPTQAAKDIDSWMPMLAWLDDCMARPLSPRDLMSPLSAVPTVRPVDTGIHTMPDLDLPEEFPPPVRTADLPGGRS